MIQTLQVAQAAVTATGNSALFEQRGDDGLLVVDLNITAVSGTSPSLTVQIQGSFDQTNWFNIGSASAAQTTTGKLRMTETSALEPYLRLAYTVTGTNPSFTFTIMVAEA